MAGMSGYRFVIIFCAFVVLLCGWGVVASAVTRDQLAAGTHIGVFWGATEVAKKLDLNRNGKPDLTWWQAELLMAVVAVLDEAAHAHGHYSAHDLRERLTGVGIGMATSLIEVKF